MKVIQSNTRQARERRADSYESRAHTDEAISECPHWRYYLELVHKIKRISAITIPE